MKSFFDISVTLDDKLPAWPGGNYFNHSYVKKMINGDENTVSRLETNVHAGTHIDFPFHHLQDGKLCGDYELENFMLDALVIDLSNLEKSITQEDIKGYDFSFAQAVLFKTKNSELWNVSEFNEDYIYVDKSAASFLSKLEISMVGIDYLSIDQFGGKAVTHKILLRHDILILEGINLLDIKEGAYKLYCFPVKLNGSEASPTRAVLLSKEIEG